jgi:hypothetical protein
MIFQYSIFDLGEEAIRDLQSMLNEENLTHLEKQEINKNIEELKNGKMKEREQLLKLSRVVGELIYPISFFKLCDFKGVTCAATVFPVLQGNCFPIVFLDESRS